jgi:hypothetical protein
VSFLIWFCGHTAALIPGAIQQTEVMTERGECMNELTKFEMDAHGGFDGLASRQTKAASSMGNDELEATQ